ncbi:MAG: hypothetical protein M1819_005977 [Sarea resinae]|nr:MAG: hypothetical protein M1819_005977 [Sarea resinae]
MAPASQSDGSSTPLAEWFWIAGVDSDSLLQFNTSKNKRASSGALQVPVSSTIEEDKALESEDSNAAKSPPAAITKDASPRTPNDLRLSMQSFASADSPATGSNRSSATIKAVQPNGSALSEADFDKALRKFASERESFLVRNPMHQGPGESQTEGLQDELSFSAGTVATNRSKPRSKAQRINGEDIEGLKLSGGSIRRRISFRDLNSMKRQPSVVRQPSVRTAKRLSNYNSVIPTPQPLNPSPKMHPLRRRFEPVLLDRYPPKSMVEEVKRRGQFPDYVPMFAFPNDINIVSSDERPRSTWHGFAMTSGDNSRLYGICVITWLPLKPDAAEELERQCEEWRRDNMTDEERELASSLGERLAQERAKLSRLLAKLPTMASGSAAREALEDDISAVEEKIGLMTDLLRPVRHGAASKIDGLTESETGLWIPRAYGILGRDANLTSFWKEWLRAVVVPMTNGGVLRVPPSSPKTGMWQPLERYVVNLCAEALSPITSKTQVEIAVRELRLFARKEAINELPGSRNTDLYALFRALSIQNIFALAESRIILLSSHTAMLHLASKALVHLLYPLTWSGVFIPVLPARLLQALGAPCPYIVGIERRYENIELPDDDFVLVDLDRNEIESTVRPQPLPRMHRRKLNSLLQLAAPHHNRYGVPCGPPLYAVETFPHDAFSSENNSIFAQYAPPSTLSKLVSMNSASFGDASSGTTPKPPVFNAFLQARSEHARPWDRPSTSSTSKTSSPPSPKLSPTSSHFPPLPATPISRQDSGYALQATLREKRSGHFDTASRRSSSFGFERVPTLRRPSMPFSAHSSSLSTSTLSTETASTSHYAPSTYAASTLAASTIMPNMLMQPIRNTDTTSWVEGHCLQWVAHDDKATCSVVMSGLMGGAVNKSALSAPLRSAQIKKYLLPAVGDQKKAGMLYRFNTDGFLRSMPHENADYVNMLQQTQGFNEFIHERESKPPNDPSILLFDQIILSKKNRGRTSFFSKSNTDFLSDTSDHVWRSAAATPPNSRFPGDYRQVVSRIPAKLDPTLMKEPRVIQGVPRIPNAKAKRKPIPSKLGKSNGQPP